MFEIRRRNILSEKTQKKKKIEKHIRKKEKEIRKVIRTEKNGTGQEISTLEGKSAPRYEVYKYCKIEGKKREVPNQTMQTEEKIKYYQELFTENREKYKRTVDNTSQ